MAFGSFVQATLAASSSSYPLREISRSYNTSPISPNQTPIDPNRKEIDFREQDATIIDFKDSPSQEATDTYDSGGSLNTVTLPALPEETLREVSESATIPGIRSYTQSGFAVDAFSETESRVNVAA